MQFWFPTPFPTGEEPHRKLRSDKTELLENYESDSSVETDEDTDPEVGGDVEKR
jgi:hypothetical protein